MGVFLLLSFLTLSYGSVVRAGPLDPAALTVIQPTNLQPLPDTSSITRELTEKLGVSKFFQLWLIFNDPSEIDVQTGAEFTILAPHEGASLPTGDGGSWSLLDRPALVKRLLLDHVVLGRRLGLPEHTDQGQMNVTTLGGGTVALTYRNGSWFANNAGVIVDRAEVPPHGELIVVDNYLFSDYSESYKPATAGVSTADADTTKVDTKVEMKREEESETSGNSVNDVAASEDGGDKVIDLNSTDPDVDFAQELYELPAALNITRMPVFNKFLPDANVSELLVPGKKYTVLLPTDRAFQRWHPIDWGFYPFSVPEFTAQTIRSHFLHGELRYENIADNLTALTLTNRTVVFRRSQAGELTANGVPVMRRHIPLHGGTVLLVPDLLFVNHTVVQNLRSLNRDKETPPLLAFPWWNAQFLSHSFIALQKMDAFVGMERLMNVAHEFYHQVPGKNYSFFVPTDEALTAAGLMAPEWWKERGAGEAVDSEVVRAVEEMLLRHLVHGRLYSRELAPGMKIATLANSTIVVSQNGDDVFIDGKSKIVKKDVFVYNLGTMFFIDHVIGSEDEISTLKSLLANQSLTFPTSTHGEGEDVASMEITELDEEIGSGVDVLLEEDNISLEVSDLNNGTETTEYNTTTEKIEVAVFQNVTEVTKKPTEKETVSSTTMASFTLTTTQETNDVPSNLSVSHADSSLVKGKPASTSDAESVVKVVESVANKTAPVINQAEPVVTSTTDIDHQNQPVPTTSSKTAKSN